jgi:hypothetical protein
MRMQAGTCLKQKKMSGKQVEVWHRQHQHLDLATRIIKTDGINNHLTFNTSSRTFYMCYEYATYIIRGPKATYIVHVQGANMQETP